MTEQYYKVTFKSGEINVTHNKQRLIDAIQIWLLEGVTGFRIDIISKEEYDKLKEVH